LLNPYLFFELPTKHEELFQKNIIPLVGDLQIQIAFETPIKGMADNIWILERPFNEHFSQRGIMLFLIEKCLCKLKHVKCEVII
jgi:hypothetical protein